MKKTYQLKTNAIKGEQQVLDMTPTAGQAPTKLQATAGARYELIDITTKAAPDNIRVMRKGKNLQVFFDGDTEPGLVIENFYEAHTDNLPTLVGRTEQGTLHEYIPESAAPSAVVAQLGDTGNSYGMALGGQELAASGAAVGLLAPVAAVFSPWLLGAGALGLAAAAAAGGSSGGGGGAKPNDGKALGLSIDLDKDNNGYISNPEKGSATNTSVTATFDPSKVAAGQVLTFSDGAKTQSHTLTSADVAAGKVTINGWPLPAEGGNLAVKATLNDGSNATAEASDSAQLDTLAPNDSKAVGLKVNLDSNANGVISGSEKGTAQTTTLTASFDKTKVNVGDKVIFSDGSNNKVVVLTAENIAAGQISSAEWPLPAEDASLSYTAVLADMAGNTTPEAKQTVKLDAISETLKTALSINPIATDNILSLSEQAAATVAVTGKVTGTFAEGDLVSLFLNNQTFTGKAAANGSYSINIPIKDLQADTDAVLEGSVSASHGGHLATASQNYVVETGSNAGKITSLFIDPITSDNLLNIKESESASTNITGKVTGKFAAGDIVSLLANGEVSYGTVQSDGRYTIAVKNQNLIKDGDTTVDAFVTGTGGTSAKGMQDYGVDTVTAKLISSVIKVDQGHLADFKLIFDEAVNYQLQIGDKKSVGMPAADWFKDVEPATKNQIWLDLWDVAGNQAERIYLVAPGITDTDQIKFDSTTNFSVLFV